MWVLPVALLAKGAQIVEGTLFIEIVVEEELRWWPGVLLTLRA